MKKTVLVTLLIIIISMLTACHRLQTVNHSLDSPTNSPTSPPAASPNTTSNLPPGHDESPSNSESLDSEMQIVTNKGTIENPLYEEKTMTNTKFYSDWRIQFSSLGTTDNTVTKIDVSNYNHETEDGIGSGFIMTNNNQMYTSIGGILFELGKIPG